MNGKKIQIHHMHFIFNLILYQIQNKMMMIYVLWIVKQNLYLL